MKKHSLCSIVFVAIGLTGPAALFGKQPVAGQCPYVAENPPLLESRTFSAAGKPSGAAKFEGFTAQQTAALLAFGGNLQQHWKSASVQYNKECGYCHPDGEQPKERTYTLLNNSGATYNGADNSTNLDPQSVFGNVGNGSWTTVSGSVYAESWMEKGPGWGTAATYSGHSGKQMATVRLAPGAPMSSVKLLKAEYEGTYPGAAPSTLNSVSVVTLNSGTEYQLIPPMTDKKQYSVSLTPVEFNVTINTFIPHNNVDHPLNWMPGFDTVFAGDNRNSGSPPAATWNEHGSHRTQQKLKLMPVQSEDANGLLDNAFGANADGQGNNDRYVHIGESHEFEKTSSLSGGLLTATAWADTVLGDSTLMVAKGTAAQSTVWVDSTTWLGPRKLSVLCRCNSGNPLVSGAPGIGYTLTIVADYTDPAAPKYSISGSHDGFPAYEVYINGTRVHHYDPYATGEGPGSLGPPEEKTVSIPVTPVP